MNYLFFKAPLVRKILSGEKDITRRPVSPKESSTIFIGGNDVCYVRDENYVDWELLSLAPFKVGQKVWVRETWRAGGLNYLLKEIQVDYRADDTNKWLSPGEEAYMKIWDHFEKRCARVKWSRDDPPERPVPWRPSIHMPRWASRIDLEILSIKVERLLDITEEDAIREGVEKSRFLGYGSIGNKTYREGFLELWNSIYGNVDKNPWVWRYEFRRIGDAV